MENQKLENQLSMALEAPESWLEQSGNLSTGYDDTDDKWELIVKYSGDLSRYAGEEIRIEELLAGYGIVTLPAELIPAFSRLEEVEFIEKPKRIFPQILSGLEVSCFQQNPERTENTEGLSGEGVLIAVLDSGIDYTLPIFRDANGRTKVDFLWDQEKGEEYTGEEINENLSVFENPQTRGEWVRLSGDNTGHGTAVAAIAATGAPKSRLIIVKMNVSTENGYPATTALLRAFSYVIKKAVEKGSPIAINLSFGNTYGPHDGTSLVERFIDNISEVGRNVICVGSGNEGASAGHYQQKLEGEERIELAVGNFERELSLQIWKMYPDRFEIELEAPSGERYRILETGQVQEAVLGGTRLLVYAGKPQPYRMKEEIYIDFLPLTDYIQEGIWIIHITPRKIVNGNFQMYLPSEAVRSEGTRFLVPSPEGTLTIPSTAEKVITVGAYQTFFGAYADFSGRGYVMNKGSIEAGLSKPDLAAPGVGIRFSGTVGEESYSGTSYATPFVTAASALLMEWGIIQGNDPYLYGEKVKAYLQAGARRLRGYEEYPNSMVGWGALCVADSIPQKFGENI